MHHRINGLYEGCDHSHPEKAELALADGFKTLLKSVEKAFKKLHGQKSYKPEDLAKVPEFREVIRETNAVLSSSLKDNVLTSGMEKRFKEDIFLFSGLKTHAQLLEASRQLLDENGKIKPFFKFQADVKDVKESHRRYLEAEYDFAVGSVLMAEKWESFKDSDRYNLQYRTAGDDKVRDSHDDMRGITLPKDDSFWDSYFPPNGWRCRCGATQVLARNNPATDREKALKAGKEATTKLNKNGKNKLEIFRFNPAKQKVVFPPGHPYRKVQGAGKAGPIVLTVFNNDKKEERKAKNAEITQWAKENIPDDGIKRSLNNFKTGEVQISRGAIKKIGTHLTEPELKEVAKHVVENLDNCKYLNSEKLDRGRANYEKKAKAGVTEFSYYEFEWNEQKFRLNMEVINDQFEKPYSVNLIVKK